MITSHVFSIARREVKSALTTPYFYVILGLLLLFASFAFFNLIEELVRFSQNAYLREGDIPSLHEFLLVPFTRMLQVVLVLFVPFLTLRAFGDMGHSPWLPLFLTVPIREWELLLGKCLGIMGIALLLISGMIIVPLVLFFFSTPEVPPFLASMGSVLFLLIILSSIGVCAAALTRHGGVAGVITLVSGVAIMVARVPVSVVGREPWRTAQVLLPSWHIERLTSGLVASSTVVYALLFLAVSMLLGGVAFARVRREGWW